LSSAAPSVLEPSSAAVSLPPPLAFDNSYARDLQGLYVPWQPAPAPRPGWAFFNRPLAEELGLDAETWSGLAGLQAWSGQVVPAGAQPLAQAYAGHQFGGFSPQLGDGRALLLGEVLDRHGQRRDIAFKGSGRTPFSRGGDGKAALGPVLREVLIGEAMHALGVPTTRALAAVTTGETVQRETTLPGAVLTRVASSHLRVGSFEFFAARQDQARLQQLLAYAIARHDPQLQGLPSEAERAMAFLRAVLQRQARLVARWMGLGFIHGVMNTDNMTVSGETIDYGPCAWMEAYDPATVYSSIDHQGRYAFGNQPAIAQWNLARLAETLLPLMGPDPEAALEAASEAIAAFKPSYEAAWLEVHRAKLGLHADAAQDATDRTLAEDFLALLHRHAIDFTLAWHALFRLASMSAADQSAHPELPWSAALPDFAPWLQRWQARQQGHPDRAATLATMRTANPVYIARNHQVEAALDAAVLRSDLGPFQRLLAVLQAPFDTRDEWAAYAQPASAEQQAGYRTFCGT
jgi:serine/tyrosine/threonine adenylyltransferase